MLWRLKASRIDDSLDVFACHGVGGIWGALATGFFATAAVNTAGSGLLDGNPAQILIQAVAIAATAAFAFTVTWTLGKLVDITVGLRVTTEEETVGLDIAQHGERAYGEVLR
jgi:Amt family ammonium transporter